MQVMKICCKMWQWISYIYKYTNFNINACDNITGQTCKNSKLPMAASWLHNSYNKQNFDTSLDTKITKLK